VGSTDTVISIDAMGGDLGPAVVVSGMAKSAEKNPNLKFIVHGDKAVLEPLIAKRKIAHLCDVRHAADVVRMDEKPSHVMRHGKATSMWSAIEAVRAGDATVCVSCGNTEALMAVSMIRLKVAHEMIEAAADANDFDYVGFVEGGDIPSDRVDVIVTDGFTGNVALKTAEGTATFISEGLREAFKYSILSRFAALLALTSLRRLKKRIDPRQVNGGVFLGLNGTVVKSHGSADATGVSAAIKLAVQLAQSGFGEKLAARVASVSDAGQSDAPSKAQQETSKDISST